MGMPCVQQTLQCLTARSRILFGHSGSLDQRATASIRFQTSASSASAQRTVQRHRHVTDLTGETVASRHDLTVTDDRAADADIARQIQEGVGAIHAIEHVRTRTGISRNLRDGGQLRLIARGNVIPSHNVERGQIDILPTEIAGHEQPLVGGDQARQRTRDARDDASFRFQILSHRLGHGVKLAEYDVRLDAAHVGIHPFVPEYVVVDVQSHASIAVGVDLHADAAHLAASQHQRRGRAPIAGRVLRLTLLDDARIDQQRHQQRHRRLGQPGLLGKIRSAHRPGGTQ
ncbi:Uncharacterised protein [Bifidobacterium adolescentis]|nr:Uncharacterised protein [Bifidobacterium adolescentis]